MLFFVILLFALFASIFGLSKATLAYSEPFFLIGSRFFLAGLLLLGHQFIFNRAAFKIKLSHLKPFLLLGLTGIYLTNISEIWGLQHMYSARACLIYSLSPFLSALVAFFVLRETLNTKKWIGLFIGFMGLIPILMTDSSTDKLFSALSLADISIIFAVFCSAYAWILLKKIITEHGFSFIMANGMSMLIGGALALAHSYVSGESWTPVPVTEYWPFIQNTLWMCLISNIICYNLYGFLLKRFSATFMSFAGLVTPLFASFFGWYFLGETISWHFFASVAIFSLGLSIFYIEELKKEGIRQIQEETVNI